MKVEVSADSSSYLRAFPAMDKLEDRVKELESALKKCVSALEFACMKTDHMNETDDCAVCKKIDSALDLAKKAIGYDK